MKVYLLLNFPCRCCYSFTVDAANARLSEILLTKALGKIWLFVSGEFKQGLSRRQQVEQSTDENARSCSIIPSSPNLAIGNTLMLFKASIERVRMRVLNFLVYWILPTAVVHQLSNIRPDLWRHIGQYLIFLQSCKSSVTFLFLKQLATGVHFFIEIFLSVLGDLRVNFKAVLGAWSRFWSSAIYSKLPNKSTRLFSCLTLYCFQSSSWRTKHRKTLPDLLDPCSHH